MIGERCVPNIGPRQRQMRLTGGLIFLAVTALAAVFLFVIGAPRVWRLLIAFPASVAALGFFQASDQTCVALASRGKRNMDDGDEAVTDPTVLDRMRAQSRVVYTKSLLAAAVVTALSLLV